MHKIRNSESEREREGEKKVQLIEATRQLDEDSSGHFLNVQFDWIAAEWSSII